MATRAGYSDNFRGLINFCTMNSSSERLHPIAFLFLAAPFYLNDFVNIYITDWRLWLAIDYVALKLLPLVLITWLIKTRRIVPAEFGVCHLHGGLFIVTVILAALAGTLIDQNAYEMADKLPGYPALGGMPAIGNRTWDWIDLTLGLFLVGLVEELVFRAGLFSVVSRYTRSTTIIVATSMILFGLIHWSGGLHTVVITGIIGGVFMIGYILTRSVAAIAVAHFLVNFIDFAGVIPKQWFQI